MDFFSQSMDLLSKAVVAGGAIWTILGIINVGTGKSEQSGQQMQSGMWQIIGGTMLITAATIVKTITF